jgi:hypothetical protein
MSNPVYKVWIQVLKYADEDDPNPTEDMEEFFGTFDTQAKAEAALEFLTSADTLQRAKNYAEDTG